MSRRRPLRRFAPDRLRFWRGERGFTRGALAEQVSNTTTARVIEAYEQGERCPSVDRALKLAHVLGVELQDLTLVAPRDGRA